MPRAANGPPPLEPRLGRSDNQPAEQRMPSRIHEAAAERPGSDPAFQMDLVFDGTAWMEVHMDIGKSAFKWAMRLKRSARASLGSDGRPAQ
jgi:hypothetical protein